MVLEKLWVFPSFYVLEWIMDLAYFSKKSKKGSLPLCQAKTTRKTKLHHYQLSYLSIKKTQSFWFQFIRGRDSSVSKADSDKATEQRVLSPLTIIQRSRVCAPLPPPASRCDSGPVTLYPSPRLAPEQLRRDGDESADK